MGNPDRCASSSGTRDNHSFTPKKGSPSRKGHSTSPRAKKASPPRKASPAPESTVLFVEPLSRNVDGPRLYQIFAYFGEVANVEIPMNKTANLPHDYGYIDFKKRADAERALRYMDGGQIDGNDVKVSFVVAPQKQASSSLNAHPNAPKADAPQNDKGATLAEKDAHQHPREPSSPRKEPSPLRKRSPPYQRVEPPNSQSPRCRANSPSVCHHADPYFVRFGDRSLASPSPRKHMSAMSGQGPPSRCGRSESPCSESLSPPPPRRSRSPSRMSPLPRRSRSPHRRLRSPQSRSPPPKKSRMLPSKRRLRSPQGRSPPPKKSRSSHRRCTRKSRSPRRRSPPQKKSRKSPSKRKSRSPSRRVYEPSSGSGMSGSPHSGSPSPPRKVQQRMSRSHGSRW